MSEMVIWKALFLKGEPHQVVYIDREEEAMVGEFETHSLQSATEWAMEDVPDGYWLAAVRACSPEEAEEFEKENSDE